MQNKLSGRFFEIAGWCGAIAVVSAYLLNSFQVLFSTDLIYQVLNFTGSLGLILISFRKHAYQPAVLNIIWSAIALIAIINIVR